MKATNATPDTGNKPTPCHKAFTWLHHSLEGDPRAEFLALVKDICDGAAVIADIAKSDELERDAEDEPVTVLSRNDRESLEFLAVRSLKLLAIEADRQIHQMNSKAMDKVSR